MRDEKDQRYVSWYAISSNQLYTFRMLSTNVEGGDFPEFEGHAITRTCTRMMHIHVYIAYTVHAYPVQQEVQ